MKYAATHVMAHDAYGQYNIFNLKLRMDTLLHAFASELCSISCQYLGEHWFCWNLSYILYFIYSLFTYVHFGIFNTNPTEIAYIATTQYWFSQWRLAERLILNSFLHYYQRNKSLWEESTIVLVKLKHYLKRHNKANRNMRNYVMGYCDICEH